MFLVTLHEGGGSTLEAASPTESWVVGTEVAAVALTEGLNDWLGKQSDEHLKQECWAQWMPLPTPTTASTTEVIDRLKDANPEWSEEEELIQEVVDENFSTGLVFLDQDSQDDFIVPAKGDELHLAFTKQDGLLLAYDRTNPKNSHASPLRRVDVWIDGVLQDQGADAAIKAIIAYTGGQVFRGDTMEEVQAAAEQARKTRPLRRPIPDDVLASLGQPTDPKRSP